jgi:hypothetical protein
MFYCASTDLADSCPKAETQEQRGLTLYSLASRLQKQKTRSNPYMITCNSVGYFTLVLCDFLPTPQCYVTFSTFGFLRFYLSAMPFLPLCYSIRTQALSVFLQVLLPATLFPPLMLRSTWGQRASSWSRGLYFYSIITCAAVFLSIVASIMVLIDCNRGEPGWH